MEPFPAGEPHPAGAVAVDALLGTGATRRARATPSAGAVAWLRAHPGPVVALDVPTGVESDTGRVPGDAVRADLTVTFHGDMAGLRVEPGRGHAGRVVVADIGIPTAVRLAPAAWLAGHAAGAAIPRKGADSEKYGAGAVLVIGGATGLTGAPALAARADAARRGGPDGGGRSRGGAAAHRRRAAGGDGRRVARRRRGAPRPPPARRRRSRRRDGSAPWRSGPGWAAPTAPATRSRALLAGLEKPLVLDADGLWHLHAAPERLRERAAPTVITPHAGEAARLLGAERQAVEGDRLASARELAERSGAVVVLKGAGTVVAAPGAVPVVAEHGTPRARDRRDGRRPDRRRRHLPRQGDGAAGGGRGGGGAARAGGGADRPRGRDDRLRRDRGAAGARGASRPRERGPRRRADQPRGDPPQRGHAARAPPGAPA